MKRPEPDTPAARSRSQAAAEWLVRRDRGLTAAEQDEFLQWLAADPRHGEWLALHRGVVADFTALATWRPEHSEKPNPDLLAPPRRPLRWFAPVLLAAAAALVVAGLWWRLAPARPGEAAAVATEHRRRILEDGSTIELNQGAVVTTEFSAHARRATLVRGEALFTVAKDAARPFVVRAGGVDVRAVGTAFSVRLEAAAVEVLVTEGKVGVERATTVGGIAADGASPLVIAGQRATVARQGNEPPQVVAVSPQAMARQLDWQPRLLDFSSAPLAAAIAEFNRRNRTQFVLEDEALGALPIVASIRSDNLEGFTKFLMAAPGIEVERRSADEIVIRRRR